MSRRTLRLMTTSVAAVIFAGSCLLSVSAADAAPLTKDQVYKEISAKLNRVAKMLTDGTSAEAILRFATTPDYLSDAQGLKAPVKGKDLIPAQEAEMKAIKAPCSLYIDDPAIYGPIETSGKLAATYVTLRCRAAKAGAPDFTTRSLFVWRLTSDGWKISREMEVDGN